MKRVIKGICWLLLAAIACIVIAAVAGWLCWPNSVFTESFYTLYSYKVEKTVRAVLIADIHQVEFGQNNNVLLSRIGELEPDIILIAGDTINKDEPNIEYAISLCQRLMQIAPVYYGLGNHENEVLYGSDLNAEFLQQKADALQNGPEDFMPIVQDNTLLEGLKNAGVVVLQNEAVTVEINGNKMEIGGISTNLSSFWPHSGQFIQSFAGEDAEHFRILISHRPDPVMEYIPDYYADLVVSGHNHGGIVRIPGIGGLLSEDEGLFPKYDSGMIQSGNMTMVISRGLGGHGVIPRIFNQPELVVLDIH